MQVLTTSGLYLSGSAREVLLRMVELAQSGVPIHRQDHGVALATEEDDEDFEDFRDCSDSSPARELEEMTPSDFLDSLERAGYILIADR